MKYTFVPLVILENSPCPWTRLTKIATGTSHENVETDNNTPINTVVVPEYHKQKFVMN